MTRPIEDLQAGAAFRDSMIPRADADKAGAPLWHGWVIMDAFLAGVDHARAALPPAGWRDISTAPKDGFIFLYCPEDDSRWLASWQGHRWYGVDDLGLTREGSSQGDPDVVTVWFVTHWMPLPPAPQRTGE